MIRSNFSAMFPPTPLKIGFFGLPLAALLLERDGHRVEWAVLSPLELPGRRRITQSLAAQRRLVDLLLDDASWQTEVSRLIAEHPVDLIVSWFFTRRILEPWISAAPAGAIGVHPSLLPRFRGPDPFFAVIDGGETETGVTVHRLSAEYDKGEILAQRTLAIGERNAWQLARALDRPSLASLREVVAAFAMGSPPRGKDQNEELVSWAPSPSGASLRVDWRWPTERVLRRIRALSPVPGVLIELNQVRFILIEARPTGDYPSTLEPGEAYLHERVVLRTGTGAIAVEKAFLDQEDEEPKPISGARLVDLLRSQEKSPGSGEF
ncbi:MAG TPA: formyltransferase family protein [Polyangiaceae bacterium]|nr:formyltransferase family protein [Polyangiaceae bacterium]